ncbi:uncharacterized protein LOC111464744 [Cucurbita moschata]|uniref:Uncharacterized protein LOC111464744 n=1 Tax=Cucurbita moschata TaxID=3662 RepID=A0A6J1HLU6_CUCMO|nr:uncharacterized protein LOC111464744 [Cucurbita moschata]
MEEKVGSKTDAGDLRILELDLQQSKARCVHESHLPISSKMSKNSRTVIFASFRVKAVETSVQIRVSTKRDFWREKGRRHASDGIRRSTVESTLDTGRIPAGEACSTSELTCDKARDSGQPESEVGDSNRIWRTAPIQLD